RNKIANLRHTINHGIYAGYGDGSSTDRGLIANNMISVGTTSTTYGIYLYYSSYQDVLFNNVLSSSTNATANRAFYVTAGTSGYSNNRIFNNNFINAGGGNAVEMT